MLALKTSALINDSTHSAMQEAIASSCSPSLASVEQQASVLWLSSSAPRFCRHWTPSLPAVKTQEAVITLSFHKSSESLCQCNECRLNLNLRVPSATHWKKLLIVWLHSNSLYSRFHPPSPGSHWSANDSSATAERRHGSVQDKMTTHCRGGGAISASDDGVWE